MKLHINVNDQATTITADTIEQVADTYEELRKRAKKLGYEVSAKSLSMSEREQERLQLVNNITPVMQEVLSIGGWVDIADSDSHDDEPLPMPSLFDDESAPLANYAGAAGYSFTSFSNRPAGAALPLPKLF